MAVNRREFLAIGSTATAGLLTSRSSAAQKLFATPPKHKPSATIWRLSLCGRRGSRAAKRHNAYMRFATTEAANANRAHKGDRSKIVPLTVSLNDYHRMFTSRHSDVADLRQLTHILVVGS